MTQYELCTSKGMKPYMSGAYSLWVGDTHVTCQDVGQSYFVFVYSKRLSQLYSATNIELSELGFYLDKAIEIAKMGGVE